MDDRASRPSFYIRDLPKYEEILARAERYPGLDAAAVEAAIFVVRTGSDVLSTFNSFLLANHRISAGRFSVLTILNRDPEQGMTPSELARRAGVTRATMTGLLDSLEHDHWVQRAIDRTDRRRLIVRLTAKGRQTLDAMLPDYYRRIAAMMTGLTSDEKRTLTGLLKRVSAGLPAVSAQPVPANE